MRVWRRVYCGQQLHGLNVVEIDLILKYDDETLAIQFHGKHRGRKC